MKYDPTEFTLECENCCTIVVTTVRDGRRVMPAHRHCAARDATPEEIEEAITRAEHWIEGLTDLRKRIDRATHQIQWMMDMRRIVIEERARLAAMDAESATTHGFDANGSPVEGE